MEIRIIGCGAMGSALAEALAEHGKKISLYDRIPEKAKDLAYATGQTASPSPIEGLGEEDILILAVKPQDFEETKEQLQGFIGKIVLSVITGVTTEEIQKAFPLSFAVRMMTNLAIRYGDGVVVLAEKPNLASVKNLIETTLSPLGLIRWIPESLFNAATALIGSGPAFVFTLIESMVDAAVAMGFSSTVGYDLVKNMVGGSMTMLYESNAIPCELKWKVTSPGGTTIAGLRALEHKNVRSGVMEAFLAALKRAEELEG